MTIIDSLTHYPSTHNPSSHNPSSHNPSVANLESSSDAFWATATDVECETTMSIDRCVDWLLDLYQSVDGDTVHDDYLRLLVSEVLVDLRELGPVDGEFIDVVLGAVASVETAFSVVVGS